ncbi:TnsA-like heteromeric transposase endonuclease subunit [Kutzneria albida]|uniref:TnsA endonuclease N-terminal domain-containing protein n=1 Tax=Kutzneria albida DSM 43870 TaxID=1449976 RepID=W5WCU7_9PSEU|nr:TnsA-like heteromeric transposase endonuclease subunit [Kutzneria albida]AHH98657.1 hypothetical protein KALB_5295 [Kutzneria albida DSM 43870]
MAATSNDLPLSVRVRLPGQADEVVSPWSAISTGTLGVAVPWRTFRFYQGQNHYSGSFWSATVGDLVLYESRLELARLLFADFDPSVRHIVAQPFLLHADIEGRVRRHVPDYLLLTDSTPVVVDVKPSRRATAPTVARTLVWTRRAVESRGWRYEVWTEPAAVELANVRLLAGYRRPWLFGQAVVDELRTADLNGVTLGEAFRVLPTQAPDVARAVVLHLLWRQHFRVDLSRPLGATTVLRVAS